VGFDHEGRLKEGYNVNPPYAKNKIGQGGIPSYFLRIINHGISKSSALTHAKHRCVNPVK